MLPLLKKAAVELGEGIGKTVGVALTALGASSDDISLIVAAVPAVVGVVFDIGVKRVIRKGF